MWWFSPWAETLNGSPISTSWVALQTDLLVHIGLLFSHKPQTELPKCGLCPRLFVIQIKKLKSLSVCQHSQFREPITWAQQLSTLPQSFSTTVLENSIFQDVQTSVGMAHDLFVCCTQETAFCQPDWLFTNSSRLFIKLFFMKFEQERTISGNHSR